MTWPAARFCFSLFGAAVHKALVYLVSMLRSLSENPVNIIYSGSVLRSASVCLVYTNMGGSSVADHRSNMGGSSVADHRSTTPRWGNPV